MRVTRGGSHVLLAAVGFGAIAVAQLGLHLMQSTESSVKAEASEIAAISLPFMVAWFAFGASCMGLPSSLGAPAAFVRWTRGIGRAAVVVGVPFWMFWYGSFVLRLF